MREETKHFEIVDNITYLSGEYQRLLWNGWIVVEHSGNGFVKMAKRKK